MVDNEILTSQLGMNLKYLPNASDTSYYKVYKMPQGQLNRQIRVSNHGTYLRTWIDKEYDPSYGINISIVFTKDGVPTNDCFIDANTQMPYTDCNPCIIQQNINMTVCKPRQVQGISKKKRTFNVVQFVYNCQSLDMNDIDKLTHAIKQAAACGVYNDPFCNDQNKAAKQIKLIPEETNKENINENHMNSNRKQIIRLTESDLHDVIKESVKKILNELDWKTYAKAAQKSNDDYYRGKKTPKNLRRVRTFSDAAVKAFKDKYPDVVSQEDRIFDPYCDGIGMGYNAEQTSPIYGRDEIGTMTANRTSNNMSDRIGYTIKDKNGNITYRGRDLDLEYPYNDIERNAVKDIDMYSRIGTSNYVKGRGYTN